MKRVKGREEKGEAVEGGRGRRREGTTATTMATAAAANIAPTPEENHTVVPWPHAPPALVAGPPEGPGRALGHAETKQRCEINIRDGVESFL